LQQEIFGFRKFSWHCRCFLARHENKFSIQEKRRSAFGSRIDDDSFGANDGRRWWFNEWRQFDQRLNGKRHDERLHKPANSARTGHSGSIATNDASRTNFAQHRAAYRSSAGSNAAGIHDDTRRDQSAAGNSAVANKSSTVDNKSSALVDQPSAADDEFASVDDEYCGAPP